MQKQLEERIKAENKDGTTREEWEEEIRFEQVARLIDQVENSDRNDLIQDNFNYDEERIEEELKILKQFE